MADFDYDLIVIGAGSGGVGLARRAALYGARVAICEESAFGGTCVHRGCVPKKLLVYASSLRHELSLLPGYGFAGLDAPLDWPALVAKVAAETHRLDGVYSRLLEGSQVKAYQGRARLLEAQRVAVAGQEITGRYVAIAVGGKAFRPEVPGIEHSLISDDLFHLKELPARMTLMGSGYIGLEFASIFNGLGVETTVMFRSAQPLPGMDEDIGLTVREQMEQRGVRFVTGAHLHKLEPGRVYTDQGEWDCDAFVCAAGRVPNTQGLGLAEAGVALGARGEVLIDAQCRTQLPTVFGIGDCCGGVQLTPYAIAQGRALAERLFRQPDYAFAPEHVASAVFTQPAAATVGLSQSEAEQAHPGDIDIYRTRFRPMKYTLPDQPEKVMMKLVVRRSDQRVLGCHMVGQDAPEIIQALAVALTCGASKAEFDRTLAVHPTAAEEFVLMRDPVKPQ